MTSSDTQPQQRNATSLGVAVVGICGAAQLSRCLEALEVQEGCDPFHTVVAYDPELTEIASLAPRFPAIRFVANEGQRTPLELAARAIRESRGDVVLLTEDHCVPARDWVAKLSAALTPGRGAVGGSVAIEPSASPVDWAFYFVDFFRYAPSHRPHPRASPSLTVCNVAYRRRDLESIAPVWRDFFHETAVNSALRDRFGVLWLCDDARVTMRRSVTLGNALRERFAFGRLFGCSRLAFAGRKWRVAGVLLTPALPVLLMGRMAGRALSDPGLRAPWLRALVPLSAMVLAWCFGEWLGYVTDRRPEKLTVAPERANSSLLESAPRPQP